ncbi:TetR/AcrR family transcriptional regulator [Ralstonia sp. NFACC01]|uniref:TetR/AcrR family transcriptional regulator n=1 Tax=Ralstonia sp. NFACC01 TaxID=1566294 RepID=UPI0008E19ED7|nr:TetR/AcrR family transcriptional regulator [Ralstonia sp. NFACC01]SFP15317.1 transcriptional regulator, TetR family [Ralstonia sp. NFACC01]
MRRITPKPPHGAPICGDQASQTRERIVAYALKTFNEVGVASVTTTGLCAGLDMSPGHFYYYFRGKQAVVMHLFDYFKRDMQAQLRGRPGGALSGERLSERLLKVLECVWEYRFLYRDMNGLIASSRTLEQGFKELVDQSVHALSTALCVDRSEHQGGPRLAQLETACRCAVIVATYWPSFQFLHNARQLHDRNPTTHAVHKVRDQILALLRPFLETPSDDACAAALDCARRPREVEASVLPA